MGRSRRGGRILTPCAHLDMVGTFNYATELIANAVREWGVMSLEEAIYMLTKAPAQLYGLR